MDGCSTTGNAHLTPSSSLRTVPVGRVRDPRNRWRRKQAMTATSGQMLHVNGIDMHYVEDGSGPDLVWLPGGNDHAELALYAQRGLLEDYHLIAVDPRGQGLSYAPSDPDLYHSEYHIGDLA